MTITDADLVPLYSLGVFSLSECRVGLRAMNKNPELAEAWLYDRRSKLDEAKKREKQERDQRKRQKRYNFLFSPYNKLW